MSIIHNEMRGAYRAQRGVSQGAGVTLVSRSGGFSAFFECATRCSQILGSRQLENRGDESKAIPVLTIPTEELHRAITKLSEAVSVALVDLATDENGSRFVLIWKIPARLPEEADPSEFSDPNQGNLELFETTSQDVNDY